MLRITKTESGMVQGYPGTDARITVYKGIPFAADTSGENRWRPPQPVKPWEGVRKCYEFAPITMQKTPGQDPDAFYSKEWHVDPEVPMGEDSLAQYVADPIVNFTSVGLIIMSGLGFVVWWDIWDKIKRVIRGKLPVGRMFKNLRLHSKIVLMMTLTLVVGGTVLIFLFDHGNPESIGTYSPGTKWMASLFQSVTTRTAGFFTVSQERFSNATYMLCLILMLIGGSPMGTAGGIKTTTVAVLLLSLKSNLQGKRDVEVHHRRIRDSYIRSAIVVTGMVLTVLIFMSMLLCAAMPEAPIEDVVYEITSAVATVGLSRGLTPCLNTAGKWIVILTMYLGRIGPLTLGTAVTVRAQKMPADSHLAEEDIMIG